MTRPFWHDDDVAARFDCLVETTALYWTIARELLSNIKIGREWRVLDMCCGTGVITRLLRKQQFHGPLIALDSSVEMLKVALVRTVGCDVEIHQIDHHKPCVSRFRPDAIICNASIWQLDLDCLVRDLARAEVRPRLLAFSYPHDMRGLIDAGALSRQGWEQCVDTSFYYLAGQQETIAFANLFRSFNVDMAESATHWRINAYKLKPTALRVDV